jgi:hypothetical protein
VVEGCYLMRDRFRGREVWERMGFDAEFAARKAEVDAAFGGARNSPHHSHHPHQPRPGAAGVSNRVLSAPMARWAGYNRSDGPSGRFVLPGAWYGRGGYCGWGGWGNDRTGRMVRAR